MIIIIDAEKKVLEKRNGIGYLMDMNVKRISNMSSPPSKLVKPKKKPKPRHKRKKVANAVRQAFDAFSTVLDPDAGSSKHSKEEFKKLLKDMSKPELERLEKMIRRIRKKTFGNGRQEKECNRGLQEIEEHWARSKLEQEILEKKIQKSLKRLPISGVEQTASGAIEYVYFDGKAVKLKKLIEEHFSEEEEKAKKLLEEGALVPYHKSHGSHAFIKKCIANCLEEEFYL